MTNKPIVLFDIDYTLFNVRHFDEHFAKKLAEMFSMDEETIRKTSFGTIGELVKKEHFLDIDKYLDILLSKLKKGEFKEKVEKFLFEKDFFKKGFYPDVAKALRALSSKVRLGIFSQGDSRLQGTKISHSELEGLFEKKLIYIVKPKKLDFLSILKKTHKQDTIFLIEDKLNILYEVKRQMPWVFTIWIKRGWYAENQKEIPGFLPDATITNLKQVVAIVDSKL